MFFSCIFKNCTEHQLRSFVQSLTWKEKLKYQDECGHMYYKVPVAVWGNVNKTEPLKGVYVHKEGYVGADPNITPFAFGKTGSNPTIPNPDRDGKVNLYLPYINGKHTIIVDRYNSDPQYRQMSGSAEQPTPMRRGANDRVDIVLESGEKTAYTVRKEWDIDFENKDRPESIDVLLQAQHYSTGYFTWEGVQKATLSAANGWSFTFDEVPKEKKRTLQSTCCGRTKMTLSTTGLNTHGSACLRKRTARRLRTARRSVQCRPAIPRAVSARMP